MEPATAGNQVILLILQKLFMWEKKTKYPFPFFKKKKQTSIPTWLSPVTRSMGKVYKVSTATCLLYLAVI